MSYKVEMSFLPTQQPPQHVFREIVAYGRQGVDVSVVATVDGFVFDDKSVVQVELERKGELDSERKHMVNSNFRPSTGLEKGTPYWGILTLPVMTMKELDPDAREQTLQRRDDAYMFPLVKKVDVFFFSKRFAKDETELSETVYREIKKYFPNAEAYNQEKKNIPFKENRQFFVVAPGALIACAIAYYSWC